MRPKLLKDHLALLQQALGSRLENLRQAPAPETLHDLRVALRRLRALLRPLARQAAVAPLDALAARVLARTAPLRDLEVLAGELERHRCASAARRRRAALQEGLLALLAGKPLARLQARLATGEPLLAPRDLPRRRELERRSRRTLARHLARLRRDLALAPPQWHLLRLDVKRLRYQLDAETLPDGVAWPGLLAQAQDLLGDWHDRSLWLARAASEPDLARCVRRWRREQEALEAALVPVLAQLHRLAEEAPPLSGARPALL